MASGDLCDCALAIWLVLGVAFLVSPARAEALDSAEVPPLELTIDYLAPPGCPDARTFEHAVASRLGYFPFRNGAPHQVLVRIESAPNLFGHVEWRNPNGEWVGDQSFPARKADCVELARTIAVALAVQIHLLAMAEVPETPPARPAPAPDSADQPRSVAAPASALKRDDTVTEAPAVAPKNDRGASLWRFGFGGGISLGEGLSSSVVGTGRLFALVARRSLSLEIGGEVGLPSTTRRPDGAGYSQRLLFGGVAGCGGPAPWSACVLAKAGMARVQGRDIDVPASDSGAILQTGLRAAVTPALGAHTFLTARVEALATLTRWTVALDGLGVWTAPPFTANVGLDLGVLLP